ncbi:30S ribosomal protein S11 [bacterium]|nr:30S ribosomal protein S11 [bacterium]
MGKMRVKQAKSASAEEKQSLFVKRIKKKVNEGSIYIQSTFNNTIITLTNKKGEVVFWSSAGRCGFKGTKKGTPYAASVVANTVAEAGKSVGLHKVSIFVKGVGQGRDQALRTLVAAGFEVEEIKDLTPVPHNGPRAKKPRRV